VDMHARDTATALEPSLTARVNRVSPVLDTAAKYAHRLEVLKNRRSSWLVAAACESGRSCSDLYALRPPLQRVGGFVVAGVSEPLPSLKPHIRPAGASITIAWTSLQNRVVSRLPRLELIPTFPAHRSSSTCRPLPPTCSVSPPTSTVVRVTVRPAIASATVFRIATPQFAVSSHSSRAHLKAVPDTPQRPNAASVANQLEL
jgi:hypothetical protein